MSNSDKPGDRIQNLLSAIDASRVPKHIAIIMDGNGRWAKQRGMNRTEGHRHAIRSIRSAVNACQDIGVNHLSMFAFSTENIDRPLEEVSELFRLFSQTLDIETPRLKAQGVRFIVSGDLGILPEELAHKFQACIDETKENGKLVLNMCVMYSGRHEIARAARKLAEDAIAGNVRPENISMSHLSERLYHPELPDPDLLIRTSGELRLSNFMLWELAYSELYFTPKFWPDFTAEDLYEAVIAYQRRDRRFGLIG